MENLSKNQKYIIIIAVVIVLLIIGYYIIKKNNNYEEINIFSEEKLTVESESNKKIIIHITGCVIKEGIIEIEEGARVADAIEEAGGASIDADFNKINLAYVLEDGQKLYIPSKYEETLENEGIDFNNIFSTNTKVNINKATQTELESLNGIGPSTALSIIEHRKTNGKFKNIESIMDVNGIGESKFNIIKDFITV